MMLEMAKQQRRLAAQAYSDGRYFEAVALYRSCLALSGDNDRSALLGLIEGYFQLGLFGLAAQTLARAESESVRADADLAEKVRSHAFQGDAGLAELPHHTYIRLLVLSRQIRAFYPAGMADARIVDIGGGAGYLACFLPEVQYVLAEPTVNGLSAHALPFSPKSFDCAVACHVFEHIEETAKHSFLDCLCDLATDRAVLLNPFRTGDPHADGLADSHLQLGWSITGAAWAKEHIDCGTPSLDLVRQFAADRRYGLEIVANNSYALTVAYVFMEHFALLAGKTEELQQINRAFNAMNPAWLASPAFPNDYTCVLDVSDQRLK